MGCDIHLYIEYKSKNNNEDIRNNWRSFGQKINPGRNYALFALMANVRNYDCILPVPQVRGFPEDAAYYSSNDNRIYITDTPGEDCVTMELAEQWVESGSSEFINNQRGEPTWVTHPDWHSHSWLTTGEFETVLNKYLELEVGWHKDRVDEHNEFIKKHDIKPDSRAYRQPEMNIEPEYQFVLASMKRFEKLGYDARIVFWFDN